MKHRITDIFQRIYQHPAGVCAIVRWVGGGGKVAERVDVPMKWLAFERGDNDVHVNFQPIEIKLCEAKRHRKVITSWYWRPELLTIEFEDVLLQQRALSMLSPGDVLHVSYTVKVDVQGIGWA